MASELDYLERGDAKEQAGDWEGAQLLFERGGKLGQYGCWARLGYMFDVGIGCAVDKAKAMSCYRRAWRGRDWVGAYNIAILCRETGRRCAMFQWFRRAAVAGDGDAWVDLAKCYIAGVGVRRNPRLAGQALTEAVASGSITEAGREEAEALLTNL